MRNPLLELTVCTALLAYPRLAPAARRLERRLPAWLREAVPPLMLVAVVAWVYWPLLRGHPPTVADHGFQIIKEMEATQRLRHLSLFGWSDHEYAGFPENVNYPALGAFLSAGLHQLPGVNIEMAYAWCLWIQLTTTALALYLAGRLHFGRGVGLLAGLLTLLDFGAYFVGGYYSTIRVGMWIQAIATSFLIVGLALWPLAVTTGRRRWATVAGLALGVSVLFHPQAALHGALAGVVMLIALVSVQSIPLGRIASTTIWMAGVTFGVCAWWLIPYLARGRFQSFPVYAPPVSAEMWLDVVHGNVLGIPPMFFGASVVGLLLLLGRRDSPFSRFIALTVPFILIAVTDESLHVLHLRHAYGGPTDRVQLLRMYYLMRPLGMLAAAYALVWAVSRAAVWARETEWRALPAQLLGVFLVGLLLQLSAVTVPNLPDEPNPQGLGSDERAQLGLALDEAARWVGPGDRLALRASEWIDHSMVYDAALRGFNLEVLGGDAAIMFKNRVATDDPRSLGRIGCTAMITRGAIPEALSQLPVLAEFPPFTVRGIPRQPRAWIQRGAGQVEVESWTDEEIRLNVSETSPDTRIGLGLGYYDAWKASNGERLIPLVWSGGPLMGQDGDNKVSEVKAGDGELILRYRPPLVQWLALGASALTLAALIAIARLQARRALQASGSSPPTQVPRAGTA